MYNVHVWDEYIQAISAHSGITKCMLTLTP